MDQILSTHYSYTQTHTKLILKLIDIFIFIVLFLFCPLYIKKYIVSNYDKYLIVKHDFNISSSSFNIVFI